MRKLQNFKCSDDASRIVSLNRQWAMIDSYNTQIYKQLLELIRDCKKDKHTKYASCFDRSLDVFERLASGAITMKYDFVKYATKVEKKLSKRYFNCYNAIDQIVLTKFVDCLKKNKKTNVNGDRDVLDKFKSIHDLTKTKDNHYKVPKELPLEDLPLRRKLNKYIN